MQLDIKAILDSIPHRYPMLLVDRVVDMVPGKSIHAIKNVSINEPFFYWSLPAPSRDARRSDLGSSRAGGRHLFFR